MLGDVKVMSKWRCSGVAAASSSAAMVTTASVAAVGTAGNPSVDHTRLPHLCRAALSESRDV